MFSQTYISKFSLIGKKKSQTNYNTFIVNLDKKLRVIFPHKKKQQKDNNIYIEKRETRFLVHKTICDRLHVISAYTIEPILLVVVSLNRAKRIFH